MIVFLRVYVLPSVLNNNNQPKEVSDGENN